MLEQAPVESVVIYGGEVQAMNAELKRLLSTIEMDYQRKVSR